MKFFVFKFFFIFFLLSCETKRKDSSDILARVSEKTLTVDKAQKLNMGKPLNKETLPKLVSDWVTRTVLLNKGKEMGIHKDSLLLRKRDVFFNSLITSSFLDQSHHPKTNISNTEVLNYYNKNKNSFFRETDEVFLEHYFTENPAFSKKIKSFFVLNKKTDINISDFLLESKTVKKGRSSDRFSSFIFGNKNEVIGPIRSKNGYHFFKILNRYDKGTVKGLEMVYDEIFQRLHKKKEKSRSLFFLDSIKNTVDIYINPKYK
tara:strand:+ start:760 stop:1542 length:783 start_codon:yes stop_codon:yes gene_type:complete